MNKESKIIIIISVVICVLVLIFAAVFMHNISNDIDDVNEQISAAKLEQESILQEKAHYDQDIDVSQLKDHVDETAKAGEAVAKLQNANLKHYNENYGPNDSVWADDYKSDEKILQRMKQLFPEENATNQVMPWIIGWTCEWEFQPVFDYNEKGTKLCWVCRDSDDRLLAIAYAKYDVEKHAFDDLEIIHSQHEHDTNKK